MLCPNLIKLFEIVDQLGQWLRRKADRYKTVVNLDEDTRPFCLGTIDYVVVFYGTDVEPKTAKGIDGGVTSNKSRLLGKSETFPQFFYVPLGITGRIVCSMQSIVG